MKKIAILFVLFITLMSNVSTHAQTNLGDGDIIIIGYNSDDPDQFAFMLMTNITSGTQIKFTDKGWLSTGGFRANEGIVQWEADQNYPGGWVVVIDTTVDTASTGTLSNVSGSFLLSASGDQIIAYQGDEANPTFLYAIQMNGSWDSNAINPNTSAPPAGLINYIAINPEVNNAVYDMSVVGGSVANILAAINDQANWTSDNTNPVILPTGDTDTNNPTAVSLQSLTTQTNTILPLLLTILLLLGSSTLFIWRRNHR